MRAKSIELLKKNLDALIFERHELELNTLRTGKSSVIREQAIKSADVIIDNIQTCIRWLEANDCEHNYQPIGEPRKKRLALGCQYHQKMYCTKCLDTEEIVI